MAAPQLVEHFFRHQYGRLVATLVRRVGPQHLEAAEDAAQAALVKALETWRGREPPEEPAAWLYRVASNQLVGALRTDLRRQRIVGAHPDAVPQPSAETPEATLAGELPDDLLRMLFVCCDPALPPESQLVLALKTLGGFSVREIAARRFTTEANVYKRLGRARARLREAPLNVEVLTDAAGRLSAVQHVIYLLFSEGYLSSHVELAIRQELCSEAVRLGEALTSHALGQTPEVYALMALMHLHRARLGTRQAPTGELLLLDEQDRSRWDRAGIAKGLHWLQRSAQGTTFSRYHAEARIAAAHALAPSLADTRWDEIAECYSLLERMAPSPLHRLNRAVAVAEWKGPAAGLEVLEGELPPTWLAGAWQWSAVLADLHRRSGHAETAQKHLDRALAGAPSDAVRALLRRRAARA